MQNLVIKMTNENGKLRCETAVNQHSSNEANRPESLLERLMTAVQSSASKQYGTFSPANTTPWHAALEAYCFKDAEFSEVPAPLVGLLQQHFGGILDANEPHFLWVAQAENDRTNPIGVFLLKHDAGYFFGQDLHLMQTQCIDLSKIKYAALIDPLEWQAMSNRYITLKAPKATEPCSAAFQQLLGFETGVDRKADAEEILQMVEQYTNEIMPEQKKAVASRAFQYCSDQDKQGESVNLQALSEFIDADAPESFVQYVSSNLESPREDWNPDRRQIQRHTSFFGRDENISIRFSSLIFGEDIVYDEHSNSLTIRSLPKSLISQIKRYLKNAS
jgi:nucleoid-associated protein